MKHRIALWSGVGFMAAWCWIFFTLAVPPDYLHIFMKETAVKAAMFVTCPITVAGLYFPLHFWWLPLINAATYAMVGLMIEALRRKSTLSIAV